MEHSIPAAQLYFCFFEAARFHVCRFYREPVESLKHTGAVSACVPERAAGRIVCRMSNTKDKEAFLPPYRTVTHVFTGLRSENGCRQKVRQRIPSSNRWRQALPPKAHWPMRGAEWPDAISSEDPSTPLAQQKGMAGALAVVVPFWAQCFECNVSTSRRLPPTRSLGAMAWA